MTELTMIAPKAIAQHPDNLRDAAKDLGGLTQSIKLVGVLQPLLVVPVEALEGHKFGRGKTHVAIDGNRRAAAALAAGVDEVPCVVRADLADAKATAETMVVSTVQRVGYTPIEEARAVQTMFDLGIGAGRIGRVLGRSVDQLKAARFAAKLVPELLEQVAEYDLTLDQLAVLAEFAGDEGSVTELVGAAADYQFDHVAQQLRDSKVSAVAVAAAQERWRASGVRVLTERPAYRSEWVASYDLYDANRTRVTPEVLAADRNGGVLIQESYRDPSTPDEQWFTSDPSPYFDHRGDSLAKAGTVAATDPDAAAAAEAEKETGRLFRARNKEMLAAETVRREFIRSLLLGRGQDRELTEWAVERIASLDAAFRNHFTGYAARQIIALWEAPLKGTNRFGALLWAQWAACHEAALPKDAHRSPNVGQAHYLGHLVALGYVPCPTEKYLIGLFDESEPS